MKQPSILQVLFLGGLLLLTTSAFTQQPPKPDHRFAIRTDILGLMGVNPIIEFEYRPTERIGVMLGGGSRHPIQTLGYIDWFTSYFADGFPVGIYGGVNIATPIGPLKHLSVKPILSYTRYPKFDSLSWPIDLPYPTRYSRADFAAYLTVAYAQPLGRHFFVEPLIGLRSMWAVYPAEKGGWVRLPVRVPVQLNLGVRF